MTFSLSGRTAFFDGRYTPYFLFFCGLLIHLIYLYLIAYLIPLGQLSSMAGDTGSYLRPAEAFLREGTFALHGAPDYRRTIGYPLFLALILNVAPSVGLDWWSITYFAQALIFALVYPAIYYIGTVLFGLGERVAVSASAFTIFSGAFVSYVPMALSDGIFATSLIIGVALGLKALKDQSFAYAAMHIFVIIYAANVRPMLAFFPIAIVLMHWSWLRGQGITIHKKIKNLVLLMFVTTLIGVQTPALRNWVHHDVFTPSEIGSVNLYNYLAKEVLGYKGEHEKYKIIYERLKKMEGGLHLKERIELRKREAIRVFTTYPLETIGVMLHFTVINSIETHWQNFFFSFKKTWYQSYDDGSVVWSPLPFLVAVVFIIIYGNMYVVFSFSLIFLRSNYMALASLLIFVIPYIFCGTSYQGARFRLWLEPFILLQVFWAAQHCYSMMISNAVVNKKS